MAVSLNDFDGDSMQLLPTGSIGQAYHEVIVAGINVGRYGNLYVGLILALTFRDAEVLVVDPGLHGCLVGILWALYDRGAMGVVVEVVVNLDVELSQLHIVGEKIMHRHRFTTMVHLAVDGIGHDALFADDGHLHILVIAIRTAART